MKQLTKQDILNLDPCHSLDRYHIPETFTLLDVLKSDQVKDIDKIWVAIQFLDERTNRLFAVWCAREALKLVDNPDQRSIEACNVAERFANGEATGEELKTARAAAWSAREAAARAAAWSTTRAAAESAARAAASYAAWSAARAAARAAWVVARAAWVVADAAALGVADAADAAAATQVKHLIKMLEVSDER